MRRRQAGKIHIIYWIINKIIKNRSCSARSVFCCCAKDRKNNLLRGICFLSVINRVTDIIRAESFENLLKGGKKIGKTAKWIKKESGRNIE